MDMQRASISNMINVSPYYKPNIAKECRLTSPDGIRSHSQHMLGSAQPPQCIQPVNRKKFGQSISRHAPSTPVDSYFQCTVNLHLIIRP